MSMASVLTNFVFSVGGFLLGFVVARIGQRVEEVSEVIVDGKKPVALPARKPRFSWLQALGIAVLLLAVVSTITSAITTRDQRESAERMQRISACQAEFNRSYRLAIVERSEAANRERKSTREMWGALLDPASTEDTRRAAATRYYEALNEADEARAQNPLPESDRCE